MIDGKATAKEQNKEEEESESAFAHQKRLNCTISATKHGLLKEIFKRHGLKMSEGIRMSVNIFAAVLPVLARGGELVLREPDGKERSYVFPFLTAGP